MSVSLTGVPAGLLAGIRSDRVTIIDTSASGRPRSDATFGAAPRPGVVGPDGVELRGRVVDDVFVGALSIAVSLRAPGVRVVDGVVVVSGVGSLAEAAERVWPELLPKR